MMKNLGNEVRDFRKKVDCSSQSEFAEKVGISRPTLISVENGKRVPSLLTYRKLAEAMGIPAKALIQLKAKGGKRWKR